MLQKVKKFCHKWGNPVGKKVQSLVQACMPPQEKVRKLKWKINPIISKNEIKSTHQTGALCWGLSILGMFWSIGHSENVKLAMAYKLCT